MNKYLMRVYNTTGLSILGALGTAFVAGASPVVMANPGMAAIMGALMMLGGFLSSSYMKPTTVVDKLGGAELIRT
jgi:FtsH-binding integral membrane protein